jgi:hypothetical protein
MRRALLFFPLFALACSQAAPPSASPNGDEAALLDDAEVTQDLTARPKYTLASRAIFGAYTSDEGCPGGFEACYSLTVAREDGKTTIKFGDYSEYPVTIWASRGVVLFSTGDMGSGDCDDPGCGDMLKVSGVIYPVKKGDAWVPRIKATYVAEFLHPEEDDAPEGEITTTIRLEKR